jgi:hypothetical protein
MKNAIFDEHKGVYRVENADGTFETYTPAQYAELVDTSVEAEEETNTGKGEDANLEESGPLAKYLLLEDIPYTDEFGTPTGTAEKGSIQEVPVELGEAWVAQGLAELVINE